MSDRNLYHLIWVNAYLPSPKLLALKAKKGEMPKMLKKRSRANTTKRGFRNSVIETLTCT